MIRPDASDLLRAAIQQPTRLTFTPWGGWGLGFCRAAGWGVLPGGRPGRALREKTLVAAVGGGRLIVAGLSSGRTCSTGVRVWVSTVESWGHTGAVVQPPPRGGTQLSHLLPPPCPFPVSTWCMKCGLSWRRACKWGEGPSRAPKGATMTRGTVGS